MVERHFGRMRSLAAKHGLKTMTEAHGSMTDTLRAYATADVPDGETIWQFKELHEVNVRNRRVASSAAHIYGKPIAAAESYTWLRMPRFLVKPWMLKAASDAIYLDGINQIRNHGYPSSPRRLKAPGNVFYASTLINHNQTWWPHYPAISAYVGRMNYLLQQGEAANDVLVYHNLWDGMADYRQPTPKWMEGDNAWHRADLHPGIDGSAQIAMRTKEVAETLRRSCFGFDYMNDHALAGRGVPAGAKVLVFNRTRYVPTATLLALRALVEKGFAVLSVGNLPEAGVGYREQNEGNAPWRTAFDDLWRTGKWTVVSDPYAMTIWLNNHLGADFERDAAGEALGVVHRRDEDRDIYFVSNGSESKLRSAVTIRAAAAGLEHWDAISGKVSSLPFERTKDGRTKLTLELGPWESAVLVAKAQPSMAPPAPRPLAFLESAQTIALEDWDLSRDGDDAVIPLPDGPVDWETVNPWRNYAGVGNYSAYARIPSPGRDEGFRYILDLGDLEVSAEVRVEGKHAGFVLLPPWRLDITAFLYPGRSRIEIRVANLWSNAVKAMPAAPSAIPGPGYSVTDVLYGPTERPQQRSGLIGPVRLLRLPAGE
ncbi:MAG: glycosyl hydrolase [Bryobacterales bacterium]|nr:glycosyl hydrolase [Bryobacterales bacterium]